MKTLYETAPLNEMAIPLKDFKNRVDSLRLQLIENWCLCKYCQMYAKTNPNFNHWKIELRAQMDNIKSLNIKGGNKLRTLTKMFITDYDFDDASTIYRIIIGKFNREGITDVTIISTISNEMAKSIQGFVNALGIDTVISDQYINSILK